MSLSQKAFYSYSTEVETLFPDTLLLYNIFLITVIVIWNNFVLFLFLFFLKQGLYHYCFMLRWILERKCSIKFCLLHKQLKCFPVAQMVKNPLAMQETGVWSLGWEGPWKREWQHTPIFLPGESHEQRSLAGYSPWVRKELDTTEWLKLSQWTVNTVNNTQNSQANIIYSHFTRKTAKNYKLV